jgi:hypothetical protein
MSLLAHEAFATAQGEVRAYASNKLNHTSWITGGTNALTAIPLGSLTDIYQFVEKNGRFPQQIVNKSLWIASPIEYDLYLAKLSPAPQAVAQVTGYYTVIGLPAQMFTQECAFNWYNKTIGYIDWCDLYLIRAIMLGYRIPESAINIVQVPMKNWGKLVDFMVDIKMDAIVSFVIPDSMFHRLLMTQRLSVVGWSKLDLDRVKVFHPYVNTQSVDVKSVIVKGETSSLMVMDREKYGPLLAMTMTAYTVTSDNNDGGGRENFVTRLDISPESQDPSYRCYGEVTLDSKALCESPFDPSGEPKVKRTVWDRPCVKDEDCPFYRANTNYNNNRGGCLRGGVCEMPVGVLRTAFRQFDDNGTGGKFSPFCYGCKDPADKTCCKKQDKPDYAFANDFEDRKKANLATFVSAI